MAQTIDSVQPQLCRSRAGMFLLSMQSWIRTQYLLTCCT